jgi:hypothetical protein
VDKALIYIPPTCNGGDFYHCAQRCVDYCRSRGYTAEHVVRGDWPTVIKLMCEGTIDVVVVAQDDHLDPSRRPRLEVVPQDVPSSAEPPVQQRRPRPV